MLKQAQLNQICIQMTTAACTPPTQNAIEMCSIDVEKEHTNWQTGICFSRYCSASLGIAFRYGLREDEFKKRIHFTFRRMNLIYFMYKNKDLNIGRLSLYLIQNMASFH